MALLNNFYKNFIFWSKIDKKNKLKYATGIIGSLCISIAMLNFVHMIMLVYWDYFSKVIFLLTVTLIVIFGVAAFLFFVIIGYQKEWKHLMIIWVSNSMLYFLATELFFVFDVAGKSEGVNVSKYLDTTTVIYWFFMGFFLNFYTMIYIIHRVNRIYHYEQEVDDVGHRLAGLAVALNMFVNHHNQHHVPAIGA